LGGGKGGLRKETHGQMEGENRAGWVVEGGRPLSSQTKGKVKRHSRKKQELKAAKLAQKQ